MGERNLFKRRLSTLHVTVEKPKRSKQPLVCRLHATPWNNTGSTERPLRLNGRSVHWVFFYRCFGPGSGNVLHEQFDWTPGPVPPRNRGERQGLSPVSCGSVRMGERESSEYPVVRSEILRPTGDSLQRRRATACSPSIQNVSVGFKGDQIPP